MEILSPEAYREILEALPTGVYLVDRERRILLWSRGAEELTGYLRQEVIGRSCRDDLLMHCDDANTLLCGTACPLQQTMHDGRLRTAEMFLLHKDGRRTPVTVRAVPLRNEHGSIIGAIECFEKRAVWPTADPLFRQLSRSAALDSTTGLPDRRSTEERLQAYLQTYERSSVPFGVLAVEVDRLDGLGHADGRNAVGAVLSATGKTIAGTLGPNDMIGCWSAGGFAVVITGCDLAALNRAADGIKGLVRMEGVPWWGGRLIVQVSIGSAVVQPGDTPEALIARAEAALEDTRQPRGGIAVVD